MYPLPTNPSPSTSTSVPRPTSTFEPISPQQLTENQNTESSPQSSLPCGQQTPASSTSTSDTSSQHTPPQDINHKTFNIHLFDGKPQPLTVLLVVQVLQHTKMHQTHHIYLHIPIHSHQPAINTVSLLYMCKHQPLTLTLHISNQTYTKLLPHHFHKIIKALTITQTNNKCTHHQHNHLIHSFHNLSTLRFHHCIFHNTHLLTVHLQIALTLQS